MLLPLIKQILVIQIVVHITAIKVFKTIY